MAHATLTFNQQGRVTVPVQLRREFGIEPGSSVIAYIEDGRLVFENREHLLARIQEEASAFRGQGTSVTDELIAERRAAAAQEQAEMDAQW